MEDHNLSKDIQDFQHLSERMPESLQQKIKAQVHKELNPSFRQIFFKLLIVQIVITPFLLIICPQFELGFFPHSFLGAIFMKWGETYCNLACGSLFLGAGFLVCSFILSDDELRVFRKNRFITPNILALISLTFFVIFGVKFQFFMFIVWLIGAVITSIISFEIVFWIRSKHY